LAAIIRTLPNEPPSASRNYTDLVPPYLTREAMQWAGGERIEHLVVDRARRRSHARRRQLVGIACSSGCRPQHVTGRCSTFARHHHQLAFIRTTCTTALHSSRSPCRPSAVTPCPASQLCILLRHERFAHKLVHADSPLAVSMSRDFALDCDAADILAPYRKQFELPMHAAASLSSTCAAIRSASRHAPRSTS
jgi:hypothetical protein